MNTSKHNDSATNHKLTNNESSKAITPDSRKIKLKIKRENEGNGMNNREVTAWSQPILTQYTKDVGSNDITPVSSKRDINSDAIVGSNVSTHAMSSQNNTREGSNVITHAISS